MMGESAEYAAAEWRWRGWRPAQTKKRRKRRWSEGVAAAEERTEEMREGVGSGMATERAVSSGGGGEWDRRRCHVSAAEIVERWRERCEKKRLIRSGEDAI